MLPVTVHCLARVTMKCLITSRPWFDHLHIWGYGMCVGTHTKAAPARVCSFGQPVQGSLWSAPWLLSLFLRGSEHTLSPLGLLSGFGIVACEHGLSFSAVFDHGWQGCCLFGLQNPLSSWLKCVRAYGAFPPMQKWGVSF